MPANPKDSKKRNGPSPTHRLLDAIQAALDTGVPVQEISSALAIARQAKGVEQSPVWKMVSRSLNEKSNAIQPGAVPSGEEDGEDDS